MSGPGNIQTPLHGVMRHGLTHLLNHRRLLRARNAIAFKKTFYQHSHSEYTCNARVQKGLQPSESAQFVFSLTSRLPSHQISSSLVKVYHSVYTLFRGLY